MSSKPLLSIAIPAYGRPEELEFSLNRFISQIAGKYENEIEIIISDDCSPNDSLVPVRRLAERYSFIKYRRYPENIGLERNLIACAEGCRGEFLWLFGDDDFLEPDDALDQIVGLLKGGRYDFYVLNRTRRSFDLSTLMSDNWMELDARMLFGFSGLREFCLVHGFISIIGFISVNIFRREPFQRVDATRYFGTMYPQLGAMVDAFRDRPTLLVGRPLICHRTQTAEEKRAALSTKQTEADFMADAQRRNAIYFSHPYVAMLDDLVEKGAFKPADIVRIPEITVTRGLLVDFLIRAVVRNHELDLTTSPETWARTARFFRRLPLDRARSRRIEAALSVRASINAAVPVTSPTSIWTRAARFFRKLPLDSERRRKVDAVLSAHAGLSAAARAGAAVAAPLEQRLTLSVITPSYNQGQFLGECLASVRDQTYEPIEHFVFDPGSRDDSRAIASSFPHVTLVAEPDEGQSDAVNKGFRRARGDIIAWVNSDDCFAHPQVFERVVKRFLEPDAPDIVYGGGIYINETGEKLRDAYINKDPATLSWRFQQEDGVMQPAVFMRRSVVERIGPLRNDLHFSMDYEYWIRCVKAGIRFAYMDEDLATARYHSNNKTYGMRGDSYAEVCDMMKEHFGYVHHVWLRRYAEFLAEGHDGVLASAATSGIRDKGKFITQYRELLAAYNSGHETYNLLRGYAGEKGYAETLREMNAHGIAPAVSCKTIPLGQAREPGYTPYTVGQKRWAFDSKWKAAEIAKAHEFLRGRIASRRSDTCVIAGNGPSLNRTNLALLKEQDVIVSNNAFLSEELMKHATYFTVVNYLVAEQSAHRINRMARVHKILPFWLAYCLNPGPDTYFVDAVGRAEFSRDMFQNMSWRHTVTFFNLHLAYGLGYRRVVLIGLDHDYVQPQGVVGQEVIQSQEADENHFHPDYFRGKKWQAADVGMMEEMYRLAKAAFVENGREVINATVGGKLELFPRMPLGRALGLGEGHDDPAPLPAQSAPVTSESERNRAAVPSAKVLLPGDRDGISGKAGAAPSGPVPGKAEWHDFRWAGPDTRATLKLPIKRDRAQLLVVSYRRYVAAPQLNGLRIEADGIALPYSIHAAANPKCIVASLPVSAGQPGGYTDLALIAPPDAKQRAGAVEAREWLDMAQFSGCVIPATPTLADRFPAPLLKSILTGIGFSKRNDIGGFPLSYFDGVAYLKAHPDVAGAVRNGTVPSALDHYLRHGRAEERKFELAANGAPNKGTLEDLLQQEFDGIAYLREHPDVAQVVRSQKMPSALFHYMTHGRREGRQYVRVPQEEAASGNLYDLLRLDFEAQLEKQAADRPQAPERDVKRSVPARAATVELDSTELREIVGSKAFFDRFRNDIGKKILYEVQHHAPIPVEVEVDDAALGKMLSHIQQVWSRLGSEEPHWSVVSTSEFKPASIKDTIGRFNESGRAEAANLARLFERVGFKMPPSAVALEYGCGVGRVTRWLAGMFDRVIGVDVSSNHLSEARKYFAAEGVANVELIHVSRFDQIEKLPEFDFLYSKIVLQHNPPPVIARILATLCSKLRPRGAGVVQIPTYAAGYSFRVKDYLRKMDKLGNMEMHVLPQPVVFDILDTHGCAPLEVSRDHLVTTVDYVSTTFVFRKRP